MSKSWMGFTTELHQSITVLIKCVLLSTPKNDFPISKLAFNNINQLKKLPFLNQNVTKISITGRWQM